MLTARVMPCLLLKDRSLVKTVRFADPRYIGDPLNAIRIYNQKEVDELILLDITAGIENRRPQIKFISEFAGECFMPVTYGGGVRTMEDLREIFRLGIEKVAVNSRAVEDPDFIAEAARCYGNQAIIVSIDARKTAARGYEVCVHGGKRPTGLDVVQFAREMERRGAGELLLTSINADGTWEGYDIELLRRVTSSVTIPVIASGGAGKLEDIGAAVHQGGASAAALGSMVVFQAKDLGVLIKFPRPEDLRRVLEPADAR